MGAEGTRGSTREAGASCLPWILLFALSFLGLGRGLWTPDEPREAGIAREMYIRPGVIPTLAGSPFYEKPPLYYWTVCSAFTLAGGPSAAAARAVSGGAGFLTLVLVYAWGREMLGRRRALAAAFALGASLQFGVSTHWILIDPLLMFFMTGAGFAAWRLTQGRGWGAFAGLYGALGLALWTKGFVGPALAFAGLACHSAAGFREGAWKRLRPLSGGLLLAVMTAILVGAVYLEGGSQALWEWGWVNHVERFLHPVHTGHAKPVYYYAYTLPLAVVPWLVPLASLARPSVWRGPSDEVRFRRFLGLLVGGGLVLLSLSTTKREVYLLPLLPPLFLLMASVLGHGEEYGAARGRGWTLSQALLAGLWAIAPGVGLAVYLGSLDAVSGLLVGLGTVLGAVAVARSMAGTWERAFPPAWACSAFAMVAILLFVAPVLDTEKDMAPFLERASSLIPKGAPMAVVGADETLRGIIPFATGRDLLELSKGASVQGEAPEFLLVQGRGGGEARPWVGRGYRLVEVRNFGSRRTLTLLRRTD